MSLNNNKTLIEKWAPVLNHADFAPIQDNLRRDVTAAILESTARSIQDNPVYSSMSTLTEAPANVSGTGGFGGAAAAPQAGYDPVLMSLVRRAVPNLMAYDVVGVQPMSGPTGLIFALRAKYNAMSGNTSSEAFYNEADTSFSGTGTHTTPFPNASNTDPVSTGTGLATATGEALGDNPGTNDIPEMALSLEKVTATARTRALKAEYSSELAQDLKNVHGLNADTVLSNMLSTQIIADINRELVRSIYNTAKIGATATATAGTFDLDVDANGRWSVEKFKGLMFQIEKEANAIGRETRVGKGNIIICSSDVASALNMAGILDHTPALNNNLNVDDTGNTFAGILNGRFKVYVDPYAGSNYLVVGYKGSGFDAGLFYCPYVPLEMVRTVGENTFQPKLAFRTRYAIVANPFAEGATVGAGALTNNANVYYRKMKVTNLL